MVCPNCKIELKEVKIKSLNLGFFIKVDQCPKCGGIWFDQYELYQIPPEEAKKIDIIDENLIAKPTKVNSEIYCPKDNSKLSILRDPIIPKDIHIELCDKCGGIWLNRGELVHYKEQVVKKQQEKSDPQIKKLIKDVLGENSHLDILANVGRYLMSPVVSSGNSYAVLPEGTQDDLDFSSPEIDQIKAASPEKKIELYNNFLDQKEEMIRDKRKAIGVITVLIGGFFAIIKIILNLLTARLNLPNLPIP